MRYVINLLNMENLFIYLFVHRYYIYIYVYVYYYLNNLHNNKEFVVVVVVTL